ncbi:MULTISPECIES: Zn-ribbon domain-containing OB-fold protein [Pseudomonadaceae]|uniref:OB-fold domain-containing protein n=1 Tax=Pseudomonas denitrificans TaxID=43306 RepID=A0A9X7R482_PSEDE|nr:MULTISPECIES: OB-fold domain-containing protein [Pseudomonadaceae]MBD9684407.1 OB-fold domain-containing protein [Pseudomonas sp. PDM20]QEY72246.1 OB-fold domain-containing protein [Pseudomonas denitrificans (nom. rej.)]
MSAQTEAVPGIAEQPWRERDGRLVLLATRRRGHAGLHFPPLPETSPLRDGSELVELDSSPRLYSFTVVHFSPKANKPPQPLGLADFPEGLRVFARLDYPAGRLPRIGDALCLCLVDSDSGPIYAFRPQEDA